MCGNVIVGAESLIGAGSTIIQGKIIGSRATIGANSTVLTNAEDDMKVQGIINQITIGA